ncbi:CGNR zinc finger domain-containing protein [Leifsonia sp. ALI-44-B]|uniref:CGNR zinc finger domain-containing protein n=1 Tax=Leifsonia sp. ALI-44-B TaxID=1933776 RepID=UPI0009F8EAB6|nr:CGNR zinc finger domain-containing protein [Leifsonia sp. ALI-44-B]
MLFAPDTEDVLEFNAAILNTVAGASRSGEDELSTREQLSALMAESGFSGRFDRDDAELDAMRAARARLREIWTLDRDDMIVPINELLARLNAVPRLERHDGIDWHVHATSQEAPLADRFLVEAAMALIDVVRSNETSRLRHCAAFDCEGMLVDLSRNGSKRFCSVRCGNRMNMVAFRERRAADPVG